MQRACGMKTVFISASPVLVNEVSRFYHRLKEALIISLKKREESKENPPPQNDKTNELQKEHADLLKLA